MKAAVIGDADTIALFRMAGVTRCSDTVESFHEMVNGEDIALLLITDEYAEQLKSKIVYHRLVKHLPIIIEIPGKKEMEREDTIKRLIVRAVGVEVE